MAIVVQWRARSGDVYHFSRSAITGLRLIQVRTTSKVRCDARPALVASAGSGDTPALVDPQAPTSGCDRVRTLALLSDTDTARPSIRSTAPVADDILRGPGRFTERGLVVMLAALRESDVRLRPRSWFDFPLDEGGVVSGRPPSSGRVAPDLCSARVGAGARMGVPRRKGWGVSITSTAAPRGRAERRTQ
jgi:hypothetical protein